MGLKKINITLLKKTVNKNILITIVYKHKFNLQFIINLTDLNYFTVYPPLYNILIYINNTLNQYRDKSGIYFIHNVNNKKYIGGSGLSIGKFVATYSLPYRLAENRYIYVLLT